MLNVLEVLDQPMPKPEHLGQMSGPPLPFSRETALENLGFSYNADGKPVFKGIDLAIPRGSRVGIVGKTGSGKSTLTDLIMRLLEPTEGTIRVDSEALTPANVARWQVRIAHVPQAIYLSDGTLGENIAFGVPSAAIDSRGCAQLRGKQALTILSRRYLRPTTRSSVSEVFDFRAGRGSALGSRALYRNADVLVFDEATSALDGETEAAVMHAISGLGAELTVIIVAHRLSTLGSGPIDVRGAI